MSQPVEFVDLGLQSYQPVWEFQKQIQARLIDEKLSRARGNEVDKSPEAIIFVEHPHVFTLGKSGREHHLLLSRPELEARSAEFVQVDRGGDITYHGPGQLVGYPILDLDRHFTDIHKYMRTLEEAIIQSLAFFGISGERIRGLTGVWVDGAKICAMGVKCSRWVTMHGFALNASNDLSYFGNIIPCGITDRPVVSMEKLLGTAPDPMEIRREVRSNLMKLFGLELALSGPLKAELAAFPYFSTFESSSVEVKNHGY